MNTTVRCRHILSECGSGYYMDSDACTACAVDYYKDGVNADTSCTACPDNSGTNGQTAQASCTCEFS